MENSNNILLNSSQILKVLRKMNVSIVRTKALHKLLVNDKGQRSTIPSHKGTMISPILLDRILKDLNINFNDFLDML